MKKYDAIIVGSGIGGLAVASLLSKEKRVLLIEKNNTFGGYCSDFKRNGYRFESSVQAINGLYSKNPVYEILKASGALKGIKIVSPQNLYRAILPDYDIKIPQFNLKSYKKLLCSMFPKERNGIDKLFSAMKTIFMEMHRFHTVKTLKKSPFLMRYAKRSLKDLLDEFLVDEKIKTIIAQYWMFRGLPPSKFSAITFAFIWYDYTVNGSYFPEQGMSGIVDNLIKCIRFNGGDMLSNAEVTRICVKDNVAKEIHLNNGKRFSANIFVSNMDAVRTFEMIESDNNLDINNFKRKIKGNVISISACKVYLGLAIDVRSLGINDYEIFVSPEYDIEKMYKASVKNDFNKVAYAITIYSNLGDQFCEEGKSVVSIGVLSGYDFWHRLSKSQYLKTKEEMASIMLRRCENIIPGIRKYINVKVVATPLTMERYTGNSNGAIYGWNPKSLIEEINYINPTTPVKNLLLSSHWTKMGGGIGGALLSATKVYDLICEKG